MVSKEHKDDSNSAKSSAWRELTALLLVLVAIGVSFVRPSWSLPLLVAFLAAVGLLVWGRVEARQTRRDRATEVMASRVSANDQTPDGLKKCPYCAEEIKAEAIVCKHCGRDLVDNTGKRTWPTPGRALVVALCGLLILAGLAAPEAWGPTLPWVGFFVAEGFAFIILLMAAVQGKL